MNLENMTSERNQPQKAMYHMIWNIKNRPIQRDRKEVDGCLGPGTMGGLGRVMKANVYGLGWER